MRDPGTDTRRAVLTGTAVAAALVVAAIVVPWATGWEVHERADDIDGLAPLHGYVETKLGVGTPVAVVLAVLVVGVGPRWAARLGWGRLVAATWATSLGWLLSLGLVDGEAGLTRTLGNRHEYLPTAREVGSVGSLLSTYVDHIPLDSPDNWPIHVAGHPPGMLLFFVLLVRLGLGGDLAAALVVVALAATLPAAVLVTLRALGAEAASRRAAPFLVVTPAAVFLAVSADAVIAVTVAWGLAALAVAATSARRGRAVAAAVTAGLLLGYAVQMSYGMPLAGVLALAVLAAARSWWPLPVAAVAALAVALAFAWGGFAWWEALPVLRERYWDGIASDRPAAYWMWGNLAALAISGGVLLGGSVAAAWAARSCDRVLALLVGGAAAAVLLADLSLMSKAEVERIWLPFVPWLSLGLALLPGRWVRPALVVQAATALLVQHLLYTSW